ncbi:MAG: enoyl-CoA hydratase/isomerase family protein, partial [Acidimicrobiales bacterium]
MAGEILLDFDGAVAIVTNNRPEKHNAFTDSSDLELFDIFRELEGRADVRAIVWRGNGKSFSSGRDVEAIGGATRTEDISQLELMERGHRFAKTVINMPAPVIVEMKGWSIGGSFERALLCDMRVAGESARMMLPEVKHGVIPDTGGIARLFHMAGHGVATDLALTGRAMGAAEALQHGIVSRVVPDDQL